MKTTAKDTTTRPGYANLYVVAWHETKVLISADNARHAYRRAACSYGFRTAPGVFHLPNGATVRLATAEDSK